MTIKLSILILLLTGFLSLQADSLSTPKQMRLMQLQVQITRYQLGHQNKFPEAWTDFDGLIKKDSSDFALLKNEFAIVKIPGKEGKIDTTGFLSTAVTEKNGIAGRYLLAVSEQGSTSYDFRSNEEIDNLGIILPPPQKSADPTSGNPSTSADTQVGSLPRPEGAAAYPTTQPNPTNQPSQTAATPVQPQPSSSVPLVVGILLLLAVAGFVFYRRKP